MEDKKKPGGEPGFERIQETGFQRIQGDNWRALKTGYGLNSKGNPLVKSRV
jgi:hypothetical protein